MFILCSYCVHTVASSYRRGQHLRQPDHMGSVEAPWRRSGWRAIAAKLPEGAANCAQPGASHQQPPTFVRGDRVTGFFPLRPSGFEVLRPVGRPRPGATRLVARNFPQGPLRPLHSTVLRRRPKAPQWAERV